mmetsp:Transcript_4289/g.10547  ORF Transcript_4289/g.10547 Transcript_4289/m.10547 type:complete len:210 (+) Transcript_4289:459-1088(+)
MRLSVREDARVSPLEGRRGHDSRDQGRGPLQVRRRDLRRAGQDLELRGEAAEVCRQPHQRGRVPPLPGRLRAHPHEAHLHRKRNLPQDLRRRQALLPGTRRLLGRHRPAQGLPRGPAPPPRLPPAAQARAALLGPRIHRQRPRRQVRQHRVQVPHRPRRRHRPGLRHRRRRQALQVHPAAGREGQVALVDLADNRGMEFHHRGVGPHRE